MSYTVKEIFLTLQGEGGQAGRVAVFCRFTGCNLWSGREQDRESAQCRFCDTDFVGTDGVNGGRFETAAELAGKIDSFWPAPSEDNGRKLVVFTGGEPLLQLDTPLIEAMHALDFDIAVESNGTVSAPAGIDWLCISPKAGAPLRQTQGTELKLVYPQPRLNPADLAQLDFRLFWLQPMDGAHQAENLKAAIGYCLEHPQWGLSLQTHKLTGIP
ncbi:7-carboxy-7-deazaguanine synthase [Acetobacter peroxydans]|jgi:7-carboxy-7-deazaguanine synthase (Cx14CxxC type)|uniref:7-carboxy-7-deazaguanine synthase n=1 Tax=Acetobacter peroxydans TaxID=104098 RepID=UPI00235245CE|nr:7-carboxy-7-deazaguanine synthase [Acetobacter peroxydans]MCH4142656.1 7-carboxy-7-deazaguanine synthase [Acetobacter peroxydans]MCI1394357.1 7-carboxy-7-deazaguanine synthase [Acetobacter peroxydans]MCI1411100.1 7-carboxy-7-deazaguanine synthase [Acetobacter peroxydans]MCI1440651.1 7-carboxy-7-deazaguanine synthase [Acetobacter peroxydans]MCI1567098.1 7-carboxy-7-deazaguanine synthase [Acetobacter peroxydans]